MDKLLAALIGLTTGCTMAVAVSCTWVVLLLPARLQDVFRVSSSRTMTLAMWLGLTLTALGNGVDFTLHLPPLLGSAGMLLGGMFVGMLASALGEILEVAPVLMRRFRLGDVSLGIRWMMLLGKGLGAVIATLLFTL
ncbi:MAG: stage V sporulation protein AB [Aristaeellaceae bacterium]